MAELQISVVADPASKHQIQVRKEQGVPEKTFVSVSVANFRTSNAILAMLLHIPKLNGLKRKPDLKTVTIAASKLELKALEH